MGISRSGSSSPALYTATLTDVVSATGDQTFCTFTVPGGTWLDGEVVVARIIALRKNDTGADRAVSLKINATGASITTVTSATWTAGASEVVSFGHFALFRGGTSFYVPSAGWKNAAAADIVSGSPADLIANTGVFDTPIRVITPTSFDSDVVVTLTINFPTSSASLYFKPRHAACYKSVSWPGLG